MEERKTRSCRQGYHSGLNGTQLKQSQDRLVRFYECHLHNVHAKNVPKHPMAPCQTERVSSSYLDNADLHVKCNVGCHISCLIGQWLSYRSRPLGSKSKMNIEPTDHFSNWFLSKQESGAIVGFLQIGKRSRRDGLSFKRSKLEKWTHNVNTSIRHIT